MLWVTRTDGAVAPLLIVVYTATGKIDIYDANVDKNVAGGDPYYFTRDGRSSGL